MKSSNLCHPFETPALRLSRHRMSGTPSFSRRSKTFLAMIPLLAVFVPGGRLTSHAGKPPFPVKDDRQPPNATSVAVWNALLPSDGTKGWLLQEQTITVTKFGSLVIPNVQWIVRSARNKDTIFEPSSAIKMVHAVHTELAIQDGLSPITPINVGMDTEPDETGCFMKIDENSTLTEPLEDALRDMMIDSSNERTEAIRVFFGQEAILDTAHDLGAVNTFLNRKPGCLDWVNNPNKTTLTDLELLYQQVFGVFSVLTPDRRTHLHERMRHPFVLFIDVAQQEAVKLGLGKAPKEFLEGLQGAFKAGDDTCTCTPTRAMRTTVGIVEVPRFDKPPHVFTFGVYINDATDAGIAADAIDAALSELLRAEIHQGLNTWPGAAR